MTEGRAMTEGAPQTGGADRLRVGVIGFAHMHVNGLVEDFLATDRVEITACADTRPRTASLTRVAGSRFDNLRRTLAGPSRPRGYSDYQTLLAAEALDLVIICSEIELHAEVAEAVAARGIAMVTEKPMAGRLADAQRMAAAARAAGVMLAVNWPTTWRPAIRRVKAMLDAGAIGQVLQFRWRNGASLGPLAEGSTHPGATVVSGRVGEAEKAAEWWHQAQAGGGALLDYCSYGACLAAWYLDAAPLSVQGMQANLLHGFGTADDNAALLLRFPSAIAVIEASWTTFHGGVASGPIVYGTEGTIVVDGADISVFRERGVLAPSWVEQGDPLPSGRATIAEEVLHHLDTGEALHPTLDLPLNLTTVAILDAGQRSARGGAAVEVAGMAGQPP